MRATRPRRLRPAACGALAASETFPASPLSLRTPPVDATFDTIAPPVEAPLGGVAPSIETVIDAVAAPIHASVDPVATAIERFGTSIVPVRLGTLCPAIEPPVDPVTPAVESPLGDVTAAIEMSLDPLAAPIHAPVDAVSRVGPCRRSRHEHQRARQGHGQQALRSTSVGLLHRLYSSLSRSTR